MSLTAPQILQGYQGFWCGELSLEHGGPLFEECKCGGTSFSINLKGRTYCSSCGKFVRKTADISCSLCENDEEGDFVTEVKLVKCELCHELCTFDEDYLDHLATEHDIDLEMSDLEGNVING